MAKKRKRIDIIKDILLTIRSKGGRIKQTHLMYKANLSHTQMKTYFEELKEKNLILETQEAHNTFISITDQGFVLLETLDSAQSFEETFGL